MRTSGSAAATCAGSDAVETSGARLTAALARLHRERGGEELFLLGASELRQRERGSGHAVLTHIRVDRACHAPRGQRGKSCTGNRCGEAM